MKGVLKAELYKVFIKRGMLFLFAALIVFEIISTLAAVADSVYLNGAALETYKGYVSRYAGELTEEKELEIFELIDKINADSDWSLELDRMYADGEIDDIRYEAEKQKLTEALKGKEGFDSFASQFERALYSSRYIADLTIWNILLKGNRIDFALVLFIACTAVAAVAADEENGIANIRIPTVNGKKTLWKADVIISGCVGLFTAVAAGAVRLICAHLAYGNDFSGVPLKILPEYSSTQWDIPVLQAYVFAVGVTAFGALFLSVLAACAGYFLRSSVYTLFTVLCTAYLPTYLLSGSRWGALLPLPGGILTGTLWFAVNMSGVPQYDSVGMDTAATGLTPPALALVSGATLILIALLLIFSYKRMVKRTV